VTLELTRLVAHVHGHLGWLSVAALAHPALLLRRTGRRAPLATTLASALTVVTALAGASIYPSYREVIKPTLFLEHPALGWAFERKEHLAVAAALFAIAGAIAHRTAGTRPALATLAHRSFVVAFVCAAAAGVIGVAVATTRSF